MQKSWVVVFVSIVLVCGAASIGAAQYSETRHVVCDAEGHQDMPQLVRTDDGFVAVWEDERSGDKHLYAQKFTANGTMQWAEDGILVAEAQAGDLEADRLELEAAVAGADGSVIFGACDCQYAVTNTLVSKVDDSGGVAFGSPGSAMQSGATGVMLKEHQMITLAEDGEGGTFLLETHSLWNHFSVRRYDKDGTLRMNAVELGSRGHTALMEYGGADSGKDSCIVLWNEDAGLKIRKVVDPETAYPVGGEDTPEVEWDELLLTPEGLRTAKAAGVTRFDLVADGSRGAFAVWTDQRDGQANVFAQKITFDGVATWTENGVAAAPQAEEQLKPAAAMDAQGGLVVAWEDARSSPRQIYAQRFDKDGNVMWGEGGIMVSSTRGEAAIEVVPTADEKVIVIWRDDDHNGGTKDYLRAQKFTLDGYAMWDPDGEVLVYRTYAPSNYQALPDEEGGAVVVYSQDGNIYYARAFADGEVQTFLRLYGPDIVGVGNGADFYIRYGNMEETTMKNAVVVFNIPDSADFVEAEPAGVYDQFKHQVFWITDELHPYERGLMNVKLRFKWGTPAHTPYAATVLWGTPDDEQKTARALHFSPSEYLMYMRPIIKSVVDLTPEQAQSKLNTDTEMKSLHDFAYELGWFGSGTAKRINYENGETVIQLAYFNTSGHVLFLTETGYGAFLEKYTDHDYAVFNREGGMTYNPASGKISPFGAWTSPDYGRANKPSRLHCFVNCVLEKMPMFVLSNAIETLGNIMNMHACATCAHQAVNSGINASQNSNPTQWTDFTSPECQACGQAALAAGLNAASVTTPIGLAVGIGVELGTCKFDCDNDTSSHVCDKDQHTCGKCGTFWSALGRKYCRYTRHCHNGIYSWTPGPDAVVPCNVVQPGCQPGSVQGCAGNDCGCIPCTGDTSDCKEGDIQTAHDPNAKYGPVRDVTPGESIEYTIEYENTGESAAQGVYIVDVLDEHLDDSTLSFSGEAVYYKSSRTVIWKIGDVPAAGTGSVTMTVAVDEDAPNGTLIGNHAEIHFPSVPETTSTNGVVNKVVTVAATPQDVETTENMAVSFTLSGKDYLDRDLTYSVTEQPANGVLTGNPPQLTYTPAKNYEGPDSLTFIVDNGEEQSEPAVVTISVEASASDDAPPYVLTVHPAEGTFVERTTQPRYEDVEPPGYAPVIRARFNEPLDPASIGAETLTLSTAAKEVVSGTVEYDVMSYSVVFTPSKALSAGTQYTAVVSGLKDSSGNSLPRAESWSFSTFADSGVNLNPQTLDFGSVVDGKLSFLKRLEVHNTSSGDMTVTAAGLSNATAFSIENDGCTDIAVPAGGWCPIDVSFRPQGKGLMQDTLNVTYTLSEGDGSASVPVSGTGVGGNTSWWYDPDQPATGVSIEIRGETERCYLALYIYDDAGNPIWYSALMDKNETGWSGELKRWRGWPLISPPDISAGTSIAARGEITLHIYDPGSAEIVYSIEGMNDRMELKRYMQTLDDGGYDERDLHGWWWDNDYAGAGLFVEAKGDTLFAAWYHYDEAGEPRWWILGGYKDIGGFDEKNNYIGKLWQVEKSGGFVESEVGAAFVSFEDDGTAHFTWKDTDFHMERFDYEDLDF